MRHLLRSHVTRFACVASGALLLLGGTAMAQTVQVFDDAPSIEQLRSIMIPESRPSISRSIVMQHADFSASPAMAQHASTQSLPMPRNRAEAATVPEAPVRQATARVAAPTPEETTPKEPTSGVPAEAGAVSFHIKFAFNSAVLPDSARGMIDLIAQLMKETPEVKVRVEGHTDASGPFDYNKALSERRALSVAQYLVGQGVDPARLSLAGKGPTEPLSANRLDPANRRVQFVRVI